MMFRISWIAALVLAGFGVWSGGAIAGVVIVDNYNWASVYNSQNNADAFEQFSSTSLPTSHLMAPSISGAHSKAQISYAESAFGAQFSHTLDQKRTAGAWSNAWAYGSMLFTVTEDTTYSLSGFLKVTDLLVSSNASIRVELQDFSNFSLLFRETNSSIKTLNPELTLGGPAGDGFYESFGSLNGNLYAGNTYFFSWEAYNGGYWSGDEGSTAVGDFTLKLGDGLGPAPVPEPASAAMWGIGVLGAVIARRRRQAAKLIA